MAVLTRRNLAKGAAAAAFFGALKVSPKQAQAAQAVVDQAPAGIDRLQSIMSRNDVTIVRDVPHTSVDKSYEFIGSDQFLDSARKAGVKTIGNELPTEMQPSIDAYQTAIKTGSPTAVRTARNEFAEELKGMTYSVTDLETSIRANNNIVNYIGNAARHSIKVVAADPSSSEPKVIDALTDFENQRIKLDGSVSVTRKTLSALKRLTKDAEIIISERASPATNDGIATAVAKEQRLEGGSSVIVFGAGHGEPLTKAFQGLGLTTARVAFHTSADSVSQDKELLIQKYRQPNTLSNHFLLDTRRFTDDPSCAPVAAPAVKAAPKAGP